MFLNKIKIGMSTIIQANTGLIENPKFIQFKQKIIIQPVPKFRVGDFFKIGGSIPIFFGNEFENLLLKKIIDLELSLEEETLLNKLLLKKNAWDFELQSDFKNPPVIPIKIFLPLLKALIEAQPNGEAKEDGLDNSGYPNIFSVDLSEIYPELGVVIVRVRWNVIEWVLDASFLDRNYRWSAVYYFFSLPNLQL